MRDVGAGARRTGRHLRRRPRFRGGGQSRRRSSAASSSGRASAGLPRRRPRRRRGTARLHLAGARRARRGADRSRRPLPGGSAPGSAPRGRPDSADGVPVLERQAAGGGHARAAPARDDARARAVRDRQLRRPGLLRRLRRRELRRRRRALRLGDDALVQLARNSFEAAFLDDATRARYLAELSAAKTMSWAPCQRVISPSGRRFSLPSNTVRKWLPASWPTMLENMQPP